MIVQQLLQSSATTKYIVCLPVVTKIFKNGWDELQIARQANNYVTVSPRFSNYFLSLNSKKIQGLTNILTAQCLLNHRGKCGVYWDSLTYHNLNLTYWRCNPKQYTCTSHNFLRKISDLLFSDDKTYVLACKLLFFIQTLWLLIMHVFHATSRNKIIYKHFDYQDKNSDNKTWIHIVQLEKL